MKAYYRLVLIALPLTLCVVVLGAYVRLSDAGLGCPDWPGCYGELLVPQDHEAATAAYPERPLEHGKAWKEMIHRYAAGILGLVILGMTILSLIGASSKSTTSGGSAAGPPVKLSVALLLMVIFQAALGMWTVTLLLKPLIVSAHLMGGMTILAVIFICLLHSGGHLQGWRGGGRALRSMGIVVLVALAGQLFLGAWTSSNYAALACPDFPTCQRSWWPDMHFKEAFTLWRGLGVNYEFGVLDSAPRATIHYVHRIGAVVVTGLMLIWAALLFATARIDRRWAAIAAVLLLALGLQITLGITSVVAGLPLLVATAHNGGAALLLLTVMAINYAIWNARGNVGAA